MRRIAVGTGDRDNLRRKQEGRSAPVALKGMHGHRLAVSLGGGHRQQKVALDGLVAVKLVGQCFIAGTVLAVQGISIGGEDHARPAVGTGEAVCIG